MIANAPPARAVGGAGHAETPVIVQRHHTNVTRQIFTHGRTKVLAIVVVWRRRVTAQMPPRRHNPVWRGRVPAIPWRWRHGPMRCRGPAGRTVPPVMERLGMRHRKTGNQGETGRGRSDYLDAFHAFILVRSSNGMNEQTPGWHVSGEKAAHQCVIAPMQPPFLPRCRHHWPPFPPDGSGCRGWLHDRHPTGHGTRR